MTPETNEMLQAGQEGDAVLDLQGRLQFLGYYEGQIDGSFGEYTQQAVYEYQQAMGYTPSGAVEPEALEFLRQETDQYQYDAVTAQSGGYMANVETRRQQVSESYGHADAGVETNAESAEWQEYWQSPPEAEYQEWPVAREVEEAESGAPEQEEPKWERFVNDEIDDSTTEEAEAPEQAELNQLAGDEGEEGDQSA